MKVGFFPMTADILHAGHMIALEEAKRHCDYLIVGLNCTPSHKTPVQSIYERFMQLRAVKFVDEVIVYGGTEDMSNVVNSLHYDIRFVGADYVLADWDGKAEEQILGKEVFYIPRNHRMSSTSIKERLSK